MLLFETGLLNSAQAQAGVVGIIAASLTAIIAKGLELIYKQRKNKEDVSVTRMQTLTEEENNFRKQISNDLQAERKDNKELRNEVYTLRESILRLRGVIQVLILRLRELGIDIDDEVIKNAD